MGYGSGWDVRVEVRETVERMERDGKDLDLSSLAAINTKLVSNQHEVIATSCFAHLDLFWTAEMTLYAELCYVLIILAVSA